MRPLSDPDLSTLDARRALEAHVGPALAPLRRHDDRRRLLDLALVLGLWAGGAAVALHTTGAVRFAGVALIALGLNAAVLLLHEGMHGALFRSRRLNAAVSVVLGACIGMSFSAYRALHTRHHEALGTDDDPDDYHGYTRSRTLFWLLQAVRLSLGAVLYLAAIPVLALRGATPAGRRRIAAEYAVMAGLYAAAWWLVPVPALVWGWLAALPLVALLVQIRGLSQHGLTDRHDALLASRTVRPSRLVAVLLLNENYHLEHHLFPEVPSYHLPALHRLVWPLLPRAVEDRSYLGFVGRFVRASWRLDESPVGVVAPAASGEAP